MTSKEAAAVCVCVCVCVCVIYLGTAPCCQLWGWWSPLYLPPPPRESFLRSAGTASWRWGRGYLEPHVEVAINTWRNNAMLSIINIIVQCLVIVHEEEQEGHRTLVGGGRCYATIGRACVRGRDFAEGSICQKMSYRVEFTERIQTGDPWESVPDRSPVAEEAPKKNPEGSRSPVMSAQSFHSWLPSTSNLSWMAEGGSLWVTDDEYTLKLQRFWHLKKYIYKKTSVT